MAIKHFCDRCGVEGATRYALDFSEQRFPIRKICQVDADLCETCANDFTFRIKKAVELVKRRADEP